MYMNGVVIGIVAVIIAARHKPILQVLQVALSVWGAAAVGTPMRGTVACRIVTTTCPSTPTTTWASGCASPNNNSPYSVRGWAGSPSRGKRSGYKGTVLLQSKML